MLVPKIERDIGIEVYATRSSGIGGVIRQKVDDFVVEEVLVDGSRAETVSSECNIERRALGSSSVGNRYLLCVLIKRNWDMFMAVRNVAERLDIDVERVHFAGIKDAKAITAQHVTIEGISVDDVQKVKIKDLELRAIGYLHTKLSSYYLLGNNFRITIGSIAQPRRTIQKRMAQIVEEFENAGGVPNFYGHQRFGTTRPITHLVGKAIVQGDIERAAMLFLAEPFAAEHPESRQARETLKATHDFKRALKDFPRQLRYERLMLERLVATSDDFVGAFRMLPIKLRELFLQAYQSYLFNRFLSDRMANGLPLNRAEAGDYVVSVERSGLPMTRMFRMATSENLLGFNEAIRTGKMRLALPIVGFKQYPSTGVQREIEKKISEEDGVVPENFRIKSLPEIAGRGGLRTALVPLKDFSVREIAYDLTNSSRIKAGVSFMLLRGSYATVVLREFMKPRNPAKAGF